MDYPQLSASNETPMITRNIPRNLIISLEGLQEGSEQEPEDVFQAAKGHGFFLSSLQDSENGDKLLKDAEAVLEVGKETFNFGREVLMKHVWYPPRSLRGYKPSRSFQDRERQIR